MGGQNKPLTSRVSNNTIAENLVRKLSFPNLLVESVNPSCCSLAETGSFDDAVFEFSAVTATVYQCIWESSRPFLEQALYFK
jgi:hypothetical protein